MTGFLIRIFDAGLGWVADWLQSLERHRELRDQVCWNKFDAAMRHARAHGYRIGVVTQIRQNARTGTKAWMQWVVDPHGQSRLDAVWVWHARLHTGSMLVVSGSYGHGEHHQETVFYINSVEGQIDPGDYDGWMRQESRRFGRPAP